MRTLVITLAACIIPLMLWQFKAKKGDWRHVARYFVIFLLSAAVVVLNTIYLPVRWDRAFIFHVIVGSAYFLGLVAVGISGWQLKAGRISRKGHRWSIGITLFFLLLTSLVPRFFH